MSGAILQVDRSRVPSQGNKALYAENWLSIAGLAILFFGSRGIAMRYGFHYLVTQHPASWQLLDLDILRHHLWRGLVHLHGQPPLFNALVGMCLKFGGSRYGSLLLAIQFVLSFLSFVSVFIILVKLRVRLGIAYLVSAALLLNPTVIAFDFDGLYTALVSSLHCLIALAIVSYVQRRSSVSIACICFLMGCLTLLRSSYQWPWVILLFGILFFYIPSNRRQIVTAGAICVGISLLWPAKNYLLFRHFASSTWGPYSLAKHWNAERDRAIIDGFVAQGQIQTFRNDGSDLPTELRRHWPAAPTGFPELDAVTKSVGGDPNWNSLSMLRMHDAELKDDVFLFKHAPKVYAVAVMHGIVQYFEPASDYLMFRGGESESQYKKLAGVDVWANRFCCNVFAPKNHSDSASNVEGGHSGSDLLAKLCIGAVLGELVILAFLLTLQKESFWRKDQDRKLLCLLLSSTVNYAFFLVALVEVNENMRYRFETQSLVAVIAVVFLQQLWDGRKAKPMIENVA
ncbi:MAG: hypothetical protein PW789_19850 [Edaphobacter sp.]|uniref:hypothetical protein n=1 Tax=Edaphobacter sp. TaxID=1934404 RepID=UPI002385BDD0|nr:hypothetical protein [Edaphobacter sp.]MDE1178835.1 hypothetical protein [Edaphobacter sp.]